MPPSVNDAFVRNRGEYPKRGLSGSEDIVEQRAVIERLALLRRRIRIRLAVYGGCAVLAGGFAAFLTCVTLDWLLWLPWGLRIAGAVLFLAGFVWSLWRWVIKPLTVELGLGEIAGQIEQRFTLLQDRLTSTVDFLQHPGAGSAGLMKHVVENTERMVEGLPLEAALSLRPLARQGVWCVVSAVVFAIVLAAAPRWARTGAVRYLDPLGKVQWPHDVTIVPLTGDVLVPVGESATIRMSVARGLSPTLRGVVHLREPGSATTVQAMQREADDGYSLRVDSVTRDLQYWFEAGDDSTRDRSSWIRVVRRPEVLEAVAAVEPPPYAVDTTIRVHDLADGPVNAPVGGHVQVKLRTSKPIPGGTGRVQQGLRLTSGERLPLISVDDPATPNAAATADAFQARFEVHGDVAFTPELRDADGFENRSPDQYFIRAVPDAAPTVAVLEPAALTEVTPTGSVSLRVRVSDDFGVSTLVLAAERVAGEPLGAGFPVDLTDRLERSVGPAGVDATAAYRWGLGSLTLTPGDMLSYTLAASDNFSNADGRPHIGRSAPMRLLVISEVEFAVRIRSEFALLEKQIRQAVLDQNDLLDQTLRIASAAENPQALDNVQRAGAEQIATGQIRVAGGVRGIAGRLFALAEQIHRNHGGMNDTSRQAEQLGEGLEGTASGPMRRSVNQLNAAPAAREPADQHAALAVAVEAQREAAAELEALVDDLGQWGDFQGLTTRAQDLLQRQESVRTRTGDLGREMLGRAIETLSDDELQRLKRARREQEQIADDVDRFLARLRELRSAPDSKDRAGDEAMESALRAARAHELPQRARRAAAAIEENRTAAAALDQKAAADAIRRMIAALQERDTRQLEELRKRIVDARQQLSEIIEEQASLRDATREAGMLGEDERQLAALGDGQRRLRRNTEQMGREWAGESRLLPASAALRQAAQPMADAETQLREKKAASAVAAQDDALALLEDALDVLDELAEQTAEEALRRTLAQIHDELEAMRNAQVTVNDGITRLKAAIEAAGRVQRVHAREATRLSREQGEIRGSIDGLVLELEKVVVYRWAMERVARWMDATKQSLYDRKVDSGTLATAERIVAELEKLIGAIVKTVEMPMDREFEESAAGDGGAAAASASKPVPTIAELLVLKAMQEDINARAERLDQSFSVERATEQQLRGLKALGEDQREVRRLAELVTNRARHP